MNMHLFHQRGGGSVTKTQSNSDVPYVNINLHLSVLLDIKYDNNLKFQALEVVKRKMELTILLSLQQQNAFLAELTRNYKFIAL